MKTGTAIKGEPNITQPKSLLGQYQYPSLMEKEISNIDMIKNESINIRISCFISLLSAVNLNKTLLNSLKFIMIFLNQCVTPLLVNTFLKVIQSILISNQNDFFSMYSTSNITFL